MRITAIDIVTYSLHNEAKIFIDFGRSERLSADKRILASKFKCLQNKYSNNFLYPFLKGIFHKLDIDRLQLLYIWATASWKQLVKTVLIAVQLQTQSWNTKQYKKLIQSNINLLNWSWKSHRICLINKNYANLSLLKFSLLRKLYVIFSNEVEETILARLWDSVVHSSDGQSRKNSEWLKSKKDGLRNREPLKKHRHIFLKIEYLQLQMPW